MVQDGASPRRVQRVAVQAAPDGDPVATWLGHGQTPAAAATGLGHPAEASAVAVTSAVVDLPDDGPTGRALTVHVVSVHYAAAAATQLPTQLPTRLPTGLPPLDLLDHLAEDLPGENGAPVAAAVPVPVPVQRLGAYVVAVDRGRLLLTRLRHSGQWTLPGGGVDFGEHPARTAAREVHEESGLDVVDLQLVDVVSDHWTGRAPHGRLEDFHAVRVLYRGVVPGGGDPRVVEVGGSTDEVAWVPLAQVPSLDLGTALAGRAWLLDEWA